MSDNHPNSPWTAERVALLRKLRDEGKSAGQIASELGCFRGYSQQGRSAVIGKLNRMGLVTGNSPRRGYRQNARPSNSTPYRPGADQRPDFGSK